MLFRKVKPIMLKIIKDIMLKIIKDIMLIGDSIYCNLAALLEKLAALLEYLIFLSI